MVLGAMIKGFDAPIAIDVAVGEESELFGAPICECYWRMMTCWSLV